MADSTGGAPPQGGPGAAGGDDGWLAAHTAAWSLGQQLARGRLVRRPVLLLALLAVSVTFALAVVEREALAFGAVDRALEATFRWVVPLVCFVVSGIGLGQRRLSEAAWPVARFGLSRRAVALGLVATTIAAAVAVNVVVVELAFVTATTGPPRWVGDGWTSAWIAGLGSMAYVCWFAAAGFVTRSAAGRWIVLVLDFVLGHGTGAAAVAWPRAHLHSLIGGASVLELSQQASSGWLLAGAVLLLAVVLWRSGS